MNTDNSPISISKQDAPFASDQQPAPNKRRGLILHGFVSRDSSSAEVDAFVDAIVTAQEVHDGSS